MQSSRQTKLEERVASVFVLLYQQLRQCLYFCTSQPVINQRPSGVYSTERHCGRERDGVEFGMDGETELRLGTQGYSLKQI